MSYLTSRAEADQMIAEITASIARIDALRTALLAELAADIIKIGQLRDLEFPNAPDDSDGLVLINAGGPIFGTWEASNGFSGGTPGAVSTSLVLRGDASTAPTEVLSTYLEDFSSWGRTLAAGTYRVRLSFLDAVKSLPGERVFDVKLNGSTYLHLFDPIAASGGPDHAIHEDVIITHPGGVMNLAGQASVGVTLINGIKIMDATGQTPTAPVVVAPSVPTNAFLAEYFPNNTLTAPATVTQQESYPIAHNWGIVGPVAGFQADHWTARFRGNFTFAAHDYVFSGSVDDGYALYIDGSLIGTVWQAQSNVPFSHTVSMAAGVHEVRIDYLEITGTAVLNLSFAQTAPDPTNPPATMVTNVVDSWPSTVPEKDFTFDGAIDYYARPSYQATSFPSGGYLSALEADATFRGPAPLTNLVAGTEDMVLVLPKGLTATLVLKEPFTTADGTTLPSPYTPSSIGAGTTLTVQGNALRMRTTVGAYGGQSRFLSGLSAFADGADGGSFVLPTIGERFFYGYARSSGSWTSGVAVAGPLHGIQFGLESDVDGTAHIFIFDDNGSQVASAPITTVAGHRYGYERTYVGPAVTFKMWDITAGQTRDSGASCVGTVAYVTAGSIQYANTGGNAAVTNDVLLEHVWAVNGSGWFSYYFTPTVDPGGGGVLPGLFSTTSDGHIHDPAGANYIPIGCNVAGPGYHEDWAKSTAGLSTAMAKWHFNSVRMNWAPHTPGPYNTDLVGLVKEWTDKGYVVALDFQSGISGTYPSGAGGVGLSLASVIGYWQQAATLFKDNPYVWYNIWNEPGSGSRPVEQNYLDELGAIIDAIRAIDTDAMFVIDDSSWGQGVSTWDGTYVTAANSGLLHFGTALKARCGGRMIGSWHVYNQWQAGGNVAIKAQMLDYLGQCRALGIPMICGEAAADGWDNGAFQSYHEGYQAAINACTTGGYGMWAWHGQGDGRGDFGLTLDVDFGHTANGVGFEGSLMKTMSGGSF